MSLQVIFYQRVKRVFDVILSLIGILVASFLLIPVFFLVWIQDRSNPLYIANRIGLDFKQFKMMKVRSMIKNAEITGIDSTSDGDKRITQLGRFIRKFKIDEITQLYNVIKGEMSIVGPRPNVKKEVDLYTSLEKKILTVLPGITDFSSIVFSDEGKILSGHKDPDLAYNQLIRPIKSRLAILYVEKCSLAVDAIIILLTFSNIFARAITLKILSRYLLKIGADRELSEITLRNQELAPMAPPGSTSIVTSREISEIE
jgi:lipopolysaccharide/colanic/teichoic acid biosynthesis glycosyltransferase